jgi:hypothetical protein
MRFLAKLLVHLGTPKWNQKRKTKASALAGCETQCLSLEKAPIQTIIPILLGEMVQTTRNILNYILLLTIFGPFRHPKMDQKEFKGPQVGGMYGPMSKYEDKPLNKLLGPLLLERWSETTLVLYDFYVFYVFGFFAILGPFCYLQMDSKR